MFDALKNMRFVDSDGRTSQIDSFGALASYYEALGYYVESTGSDSYSLVPFTEEYDDYDSIFNITFFAISADVANTDCYCIECLTAGTFSSYGFAKSTLFTKDTTADDIMGMLRGISDKTLLSDLFMGCRFDFASSSDAMRVGDTAMASQFLMLGVSSSNIITNSLDFFNVLMTVDSDVFDLGTAQICFVSSSEFVEEDGNIYTVGQLRDAIAGTTD